MTIQDLEKNLRQKGFEIDSIDGDYWTHYMYNNRETGEYFSVVRHWKGKYAGKTFWEYKVHGRKEKKGSGMELLEDYIMGKPLDKYYEERKVKDRKVTISPAPEHDRKYGFVRELRIGPGFGDLCIPLTPGEYAELMHEIEIDGKEDLNI